jgi:hypothetical protein
MSEMPHPPKGLRKPEQQAEITRKDRVQYARPKKRPVNEVVRYCVRIPPQAERYEGDRGKGQEQTAVRQCKHDKERVVPPPAFRLPEQAFRYHWGPFGRDLRSRIGP